MINRIRVTFSIILISLSLVLFSCNGEQNPPKNNERTFCFTDSGPRYMIRYNSSSDKTVPLSDTGYIKSYSSAVSEKPTENVSDRTASRGLSGVAGGEGVRVILTDSGDEIGMAKQFFVYDSDEEGNKAFSEVSMRLKESGEHCLIWCEDSLKVPEGSLKTLQEKFDTIYALETALFGLNKEVEFSVGDITVTAPAIDLMNIRSSQGELISESSVMPFPYSEIIKSNDYAAVQLHLYGFILSDLARDDEMSGEKPIRNAGRIVIELPSNPDVKIYFH